MASRRDILKTSAVALVASVTQAGAAVSTDDAHLLRLVDEILETHARSARLSTEADNMQATFRQKEAFRAARVFPLVRRGAELRAALVAVPATTMAGLRAKARAVRGFSNCEDGYASAHDDDALAWSLASDILGVPAVLKHGNARV